LQRVVVEEYGEALADATRIQIVSLLARQRTPMSIGEVVTASGEGQSTVVRFVPVSDQRGLRELLPDRRRRGRGQPHRNCGLRVVSSPFAQDDVLAAA
ncbi:hypothetical protein JYK22_29415, partial [Nonomuraea sp. RK-328]|nr:hypothetical protein [Nonomuraea sp. RK-328]